MRKGLEQQSSELTLELLNLFFSEIKQQLPNIKFEYNNQTDVKIPALNNKFGDLEILFDYREITVYIKDVFHTHFEIDFIDSDTHHINGNEAINELIEFIQDIVNDTLLLKVTEKNGRIIKSGIVHKDDPNIGLENMMRLSDLWDNFFSKNKRTILCSWSGAEKEL